MTSYKHNDLETYSDFENMPMFDCENPNMELLQGITSYGFTEPSSIQALAIAPLYEGHNLIAQSQSGTGKTGSFVIGTLSRIDRTLDRVQAIIIAPTHELATQTYHVVKSLASYMFDVEKGVTLCVGKQVSVEENIMHIANGSKIVIGTPGRVMHMVAHLGKRGSDRRLIDPSSCKMLILDEADTLLTKERENVCKIIDILTNKQFRRDGPDLQYGIFSATFNDEETIEYAKSICRTNEPKMILLKPEAITLDSIVQYYFDLGDVDQYSAFNSKVEFIKLLYESQVIPTTMIYTNNSDSARRLYEALSDTGMQCGCIYGSLSPGERLEVSKAFRVGDIRILISTDLLARGYDVRQVSLVINFDLPYVFDSRTVETKEQKIADYLHRIGRSGRYGRKGVAINLIGTSSENQRKTIIEDFYGIKMLNLPDDLSVILQ